MEQTSDAVSEGKLISETTYLQRSSKYTEIDLDGVKIDFYDPVNKVVHEVKKSSKMEMAHEWQVKYYLYCLMKAGIIATGLLEYPKLKKTKEVMLEDQDITFLEKALNEIEAILDKHEMPDVIDKPYCKRCSYFEFCYS